MYEKEDFLNTTKRYAELMQNIYNRNTAGELTFEGVFMLYAMKLESDNAVVFPDIAGKMKSVIKSSERAREVYEKRLASELIFEGMLTEFIYMAGGKHETFSSYSSIIV